MRARFGKKVAVVVSPRLEVDLRGVRIGKTRPRVSRSVHIHSVNFRDTRSPRLGARSEARFRKTRDSRSRLIVGYREFRCRSSRFCSPSPRTNVRSSEGESILGNMEQFRSR